MNKISLVEYCKKFNSDFSNYLKNNLSKLEAVWHAKLLPAEANNLYTNDLLEYTIKSLENGKRIRPYLVYLAAEDSNYEESLNYAMAIELLHSFALVHDDVMDRSDKRRGEKTVFKYFSDKIKHLNDDHLHLAYSMAILVGDILFSLSEGAFEDRHEKVSDKQHNQARKLFQILKSEVMLGQMLDIEIGLLENPSKELILQKTYLKTANYSITRPLQIGQCISIQNTKLNDETCLEIGFNLGVAFQLQDDFLNLAYNETITGKQQFSDLIEKKSTLASWFIFNELSEAKKLEFLSNFWGNPNIKDQAASDFLIENGVIDYIENEFKQYYTNAEKLSDKYPELKELIKLFSNRKY